MHLGLRVHLGLRTRSLGVFAQVVWWCGGVQCAPRGKLYTHRQTFKTADRKELPTHSNYIYVRGDPVRVHLVCVIDFSVRLYLYIFLVR